MKNYIISLVFIGSLAACLQRAEVNETQAIETAVDSFDSIKAKQLGADDYGMKTYVVAFLYAGQNRPKDSIHSADLQRSHLNNIKRMAKENKLVLAGPFYGNDSLRGIYIFNTTTIEEAKAWTETDPSIQYGSLRMELKQWYGSAALMQVNEIHKQIAKTQF